MPVMKISLSQPIWQRLYGAYGHWDFAAAVGRLAEGWDDTVWDDLFGQICHQETL